MSTSQRKSSSSSAKPDRRSVVLTGAAFVGASALPRPAPAADDGLAPAADLLAAMRTFLSSLEPDKRKAAAFAWDGREWRGWNYFGSAGNIKPGLRLEQMNPAQKATAWDLLATLLSPAGREKARNVMTLQDVLWRRAATAPASARRSGSRSRSTARRPRPGHGASGSKGITSPSRSPCAPDASFRSPRRRSRPTPTGSRRDRIRD